MGEGTQRPVGERRRRREMARAAELAAERSGTAPPLTRRELRRREAEEAARLEAIATGELRLADLQADWVGSARSAASAPTPGPSASTGASAPTAASAPAVSAATASSGDSAATASSGATAPMRPPSRRSLRDRVPAGDVPERPTERTATGRRPVVRTPPTARGIRALDATGQLTGIQPVVRPDEPSSAGPAGIPADDLVGDNGRFAVDVDGPVRTARDALAASSTVPPTSHETSPTRGETEVPHSVQSAGSGPGSGPATAGSPAVPEESASTAEPSADSGEFTLHPRWVAINSVTGASPDEAQLPSRRSIRSQPTQSPQDTREPEDGEPEPTNPALTIVKVTVLALVAVILGALIWLLGSEALGDESAAAPSAPTISTAPYTEETRGR